MNLRVIVVTYNSAVVIERCLRSCQGIAVTVVDNASSDGTHDLVHKLGLPKVDLVRNERNAGFAAAVNQAVLGVREEFLLLLNPDVELLVSPEPLVEALQRPGFGIAAGRLLGEDDTDQKGFAVRRFPTPAALAFEALGWNSVAPGNRVNRAYRYADRNWNEAGEVEQPAGAFLAFRRQLWEKLGGFDERFHPVWFEDVDFCKRASESGSRIYYLPDVSARHVGGDSVRRLSWECREALWYDSLLKYASKHFRPSGRRGVGVAVAVGSVVRALISIARRRNLRPVLVYAGVFRKGAGYLFSAGFESHKSGTGVAELDKTEHQKLSSRNHLHVP